MCEFKIQELALLNYRRFENEKFTFPDEKEKAVISYSIIKKKTERAKCSLRFFVIGNTA